MNSNWLVIGICGVTCSGKTTLAKEIAELLPGSEIISQDDYFYPKDSGKHTLIPELNHFNWEILSSLDMEKMYTDIKKLTNDKLLSINVKEILNECNSKKDKLKRGSTDDICKNIVYAITNKFKKHNLRLLILEGFSILNYESIDNLCHLKFYLTLSRETCFKRRSNRTYDPPDVPGYFDKCVWPEYIRQFEDVRKKSENVIYLTEEMEEKCKIIVDYLLCFMQKV